MEKLNDIVERKQLDDSNKSTLKTFYSKCFNILRNSEHLTGDKALRNLSYLLILKLLEPKLEEINFNNYDYIFEELKDSEKSEIIKFTKFSFLGKSKDVNIYNQLRLVWQEILSNHPKTREIFRKRKTFDIKRNSTYVNLIKEISNIDFSLIDHDIQGEAYENILKDTMSGKVLGQFFTPPILKKLCVDLVKPRIKQDGKIETIFDPAMGTGGFLITSVKHLEKESKSKNINLDWDFISTKGLGGIEAEPDTFQLAKSNMLISTGHLFSNIKLGDSIRNSIEGKYDIVLANPPYGIKGLNYIGIENINRDKYLPIKSNSAVPLFLQAIINILKINGRCAIILPNGKDLNGEQTDLISTREYLMKTCDLKEVIYLPAGIFTHTPIRTCIFYFIKKRDIYKVVKTKITISKTSGKETKRSYQFTKTHQTTNVKFYECNPHTSFKELKVDVPIEQIANNSYSLNYNDYLEDGDEYKNTKNIKWVTLKDICIFKRGKQLSKKNFIKGIYPVIGGGQSATGYHNQFNKDENTILCSSSGAYAGFINRYSSKVWASDCFSIHTKNNKKLNENYLYYYLKHIQDDIYKLQTGTAQPHVYPKTICDMKFPLPNMELQNKIIATREKNFNKITSLKKTIKKIQNMNNDVMLSIFEDSSEDTSSSGSSSEDTSDEE